jgi:outer membrane receptor protein involved in Fe transport
LKKTPRTDGGFEAYGATSADYRTNGEQWYGRQSFWGGDDVWGFRAGYGHRTGSDYSSGDDLLIPSSYKSREVDLALGAQLTPDSGVEGQALRLDQTDVELAGQAFDIDWLVTDGYEVQYVIEQANWADVVTLESWYNRTKFEGSAQRPSKRSQFPFYDRINFVGFTDVDSMSAGYRLVSHWETADGARLDAGPDLRFIKQELNEITSGRRGFSIWTDANSPIPRSDYVNPGLFVEVAQPVVEDLSAVAGGRLDYVGTRVLEDSAELAALGVQSGINPAAPLSAADIWGSDDLQQDEIVGLGYFGLDAQVVDGWSIGAKVGYSERAPNLTERYVVESFMALLQNGLNTVTGDPELDKEKLIQTDLRLVGQTGDFRGELVGYYAWVRDYITYEAMSVVTGPPNAQIEQVNLKFVNTELATLWGCEARAEFDWNDFLTPFATVRYVQGTDRTRNGDFATQQATSGSPSTRVEGAARGSFSGIPGEEKEPLPSILPLESRLGLRWEEKRTGRWGVELAARVVDAQNRVAASLLESTTPGFATWDLRTFVRPIDGLTLIGGVENFTDKQYREHLDFRSRNPIALSTFRPGVNFYFGTEYQY